MVIHASSTMELNNPNTTEHTLPFIYTPPTRTGTLTGGVDPSPSRTRRRPGPVLRPLRLPCVPSALARLFQLAPTVHRTTRANPCLVAEALRARLSCWSLLSSDVSPPRCHLLSGISGVHKLCIPGVQVHHPTPGVQVRSSHAVPTHEVHTHGMPGHSRPLVAPPRLRPPRTCMHQLKHPHSGSSQTEHRRYGRPGWKCIQSASG